MRFEASDLPKWDTDALLIQLSCLLCTLVEMLIIVKDPSVDLIRQGTMEVEFQLFVGVLHPGNIKKGKFVLCNDAS